MKEPKPHFSTDTADVSDLAKERRVENVHKHNSQGHRMWEEAIAAWRTLQSAVPSCGRHAVAMVSAFLLMEAPP